MTLFASTAIPPDAYAARSARLWCKEELAAALAQRTPDPQVLQDALVVVSELVTNALRAGCVHITLQLFVGADEVRLAVIDDGEGLPTRQFPEVDAPHGRGLAIVGALSRTWGVARVDQGKQVWADLSLGRA